MVQKLIALVLLIIIAVSFHYAGHLWVGLSILALGVVWLVGGSFLTLRAAGSLARAGVIVGGALRGAVAGFFLGVFGWVTLYYLFAMLPKGIPFRAMDQASMLIVITGPLGAIIGVFIGGALARSRLKHLAPPPPETHPPATPEISSPDEKMPR